MPTGDKANHGIYTTATTTMTNDFITPNERLYPTKPMRLSDWLLLGFILTYVGILIYCYWRFR